MTLYRQISIVLVHSMIIFSLRLGLDGLRSSNFLLFFRFFNESRFFSVSVDYFYFDLGSTLANDTKEHILLAHLDFIVSGYLNCLVTIERKFQIKRIWIRLRFIIREIARYLHFGAEEDEFDREWFAQFFDWKERYKEITGKMACDGERKKLFIFQG